MAAVIRFRGDKLSPMIRRKRSQMKWNLPPGKFCRKRAKYWRLCKRSALSKLECDDVRLEAEEIFSESGGSLLKSGDLSAIFRFRTGKVADVTWGPSSASVSTSFLRRVSCHISSADVDAERLQLPSSVETMDLSPFKLSLSSSICDGRSSPVTKQTARQHKSLQTALKRLGIISIKKCDKFENLGCSIADEYLIPRPNLRHLCSHTGNCLDQYRSE